MVAVRSLAIALCLTRLACAVAETPDLLLADGKSWPGRLLVHRQGAVQPLLERSATLPQEVVPRVQSVTVLPGGRTVFCSGLDRQLRETAPGGERELLNGGYLARQVRTGADGQLYWSGLETPRDGAPLPDGFIYRWNPANGQSETLLTFSQGDVGRDWWGAFDLRGDHVIVGTLQGRTKLFDVSVSPVRAVGELPIAATAFRFAPDGSLWACDGQGAIYRFTELDGSQPGELILRSPTPFVDFAWR